MPDHLKDLEQHITPTQAGIVIERHGATFPSHQQSAQRLPKHPTHFVVDVHGNADKAMAGGRDLSAKDTADIIRASGWDGKQPILLVGCQTGAKPDGFAAQLSRELGGEVTAPNRDAWVDDRGNLFASSSHQGPKDMRPGWPPNGQWATFMPDGTNTPHSTSSPPGHVPDWRAVGGNGPDYAYRRGEAPGSAHGPTTSDPSIADRLDPHNQARNQVDDSDATAQAEEKRPPRIVVPEGTPLFFENKPNFRATAHDVHHMRQSYPPDMWDMDAKDVDAIVARNPQFSVVPRDQLIALRGHTNHHTFDTVNNALRTNDIQTLRRYEGYVRTINSALNHLPPVQGVVSRVINTQHAALRASQYTMGAVVTERGFLSSSANGPSQFPGKVVMQIHSLTGRYIAPVSHRPHEREVLFPSGTQFKVVGTGFDPKTGTHYVQLREIPAAQPPQRPMAPPHQQQPQHGGYAQGRQPVPTQGPRPNVYNGPQGPRQQPPLPPQQRPYQQQQRPPAPQPYRQPQPPVQRPPSLPDRAQATMPLQRPHVEESPTQPLRQETQAPQRPTPTYDSPNRPENAPSQVKSLDELIASAPDPDPAPVEIPKDRPVHLKDFDDQDRLPHVAENIRGTRAGISLFGKDESDHRLTARAVKEIPGHFVVDTHGKPGALLSNNRPLSGQDVVNILDALPHSVWDRKTPIIFTGCGTGKDANGVAAHVARHFGVETVAARSDTWVDDNGNIYSAESATDIPTGFPPKSKWPPNGEWARFTPDGLVHTSESPYPPGHTPDWGHETPAERPADAFRRGEDPEPSTQDETQPQQPRLTADDVRTYLDRPDVSEALDRAVGPEHKVKIDGAEQDIRDHVRERLPHHPELVEAMRRADYLEKSLLGNPRTISSLLKYPDAIPILTEAVNEVDTRGTAPILKEYTPGAATPTPLTTDQLKISGAAKNSARSYGQEAAYQVPMGNTSLDDYMDARYKDAGIAQRNLTEIVNELGPQLGGEAKSRPGPKDRHRAMAKVLGDYEGDASLLTDLVGAKITFESLETLYRAMNVIRADSRLEIVKFKDRFAKPQDSGYRDLQMSIRMQPNNHIAELRLHLAALDDVSDWEHSLYEVTRDFEATAKTEKRDMAPEEKALQAAVNTQLRVLFWRALSEVL